MMSNGMREITAAKGITSASPPSTDITVATNVLPITTVERNRVGSRSSCNAARAPRFPSSASCSKRPLRAAMIETSAAEKNPLARISSRMMIKVPSTYVVSCEGLTASAFPAVTARLSRCTTSSCGRWPSAAAICSVFRPLIRNISSAV